MFFNTKCLIQIILITIFCSCVLAKLPDKIAQCRAGHKECIIKSVNDVIINNIRGNKEFGLEGLDPIVIGDILAKTDAKNPVSLNLNFFKMVIHGLKDIRAEKVKGFGKTPDGRHDMLLHGPVVQLLGNYKTDGKVLLLPVRGEGPCNLTLSNYRLKISIEGASLEKNGQLYMDVKSTAMDLDVDRVYMKFDNLFNGDKALGDNINTLINEHWREIFDDFKSFLLSKINEKLFEICTGVFSTTPYKDLVQTS